MNEIRDKFHDKEANDGFLLGCDVKKSRFGSEEKKIEITLKTASGEYILNWPIKAEFP